MTTTSTVQCVTCALFSLRDNATYAELGFGRCAVMRTSRPGSFVSPERPRQCPDHQPVPAEKAAARIEWLRELRSEGA